jgi:hypothetical protein
MITALRRRAASATFPVRQASRSDGIDVPGVLRHPETLGDAVAAALAVGLLAGFLPSTMPRVPIVDGLRHVG